MSSYRRGSVRGQGLVEYALIFALVAIAVIVLLAATGEKIGEALCDVIIKSGQGVPPNIKLCAAPRLTFSGIVGGETVNGIIVVEAIVQDDKIQQANDILSVKFYVDEALIHTTNGFRYCLAGGGPDCGNYDTHQLSNGSHLLRVVAEDADHNLGETRVTFLVQN